VPSLRNNSPEKRGIDWPAIGKTLLIQLLVLLALSAAFVRYLNWSSDAAWAKLQPQSATSVRAAPCLRRA
jgi:hypothetical protein